MARKIYFGTSSSIKFNQYEKIFSDLGIELIQVQKFSNILIEPQGGDDIHRVVTHPLKLAARFVAQQGQIPFMIEDTMLFLEPFSKRYMEYYGLPGADTKNWWNNLGIDGFLELLDGQKSRNALFFCKIGAYFGGQFYQFAEAFKPGIISEEVRVSKEAELGMPVSNPEYFHSVFIPEGSTKTMGEMGPDVFPEYDYRRECAKNLVDKINSVNWYEETQFSLDLV